MNDDKERLCRFRQAIEDSRMLLADVADKIDVSTGHMLKLSSGHARLTQKNAQLFCEKLGYNFDWLWNNEGTMKANSSSKSPFKELEKDEVVDIILDEIFDLIKGDEAFNLLNHIKEISQHLKIPELKLFKEIIVQKLNNSGKLRKF